MTVERVRRWFERIPEIERDVPIILINGRVYTPREVKSEVERGTTLGRRMQEELEKTVSHITQLHKIGKARALYWAKGLPEDFSIGSYSIEKPIATKSEIIRMIEQEEEVGESAVKYEEERAYKLRALF